jgi:8-oxo-dGTP pyrophosphatase MutT (NUDIX family)
MKLPIFNPRETPSRILSELEPAKSVLPSLYTRAAIEKILNLKNSELNEQLSNVSLLRRDVQLIEQPREAAVLILLIEYEDTLDVVFTVRASHLRHHAGQVSFVGGGVEDGESMIQAALREAHEEIGLDTRSLEVLGELPIYHTITGFAVTPIIACLTAAEWSSQQLKIDTQEVDHVFTVPLAFLLDHDNIYVHDFEWENNHRQYYSVTYNEYFIWGASMAMLRNLDLLLRAF